VTTRSDLRAFLTWLARAWLHLGWVGLLKLLTSASPEVAITLLMKMIIPEITDEERNHKKSRNRQLLTAGLATVATIHAASNVHSSIAARDARHLAVKEGEISKSEAKKEKNKARLQDAASIGIAALGIKGAISEWKEVKEKREEAKEEREKTERHRQKRAARRAKFAQLQQDGMSNGTYNSSYASSAPNLQSPSANRVQRPNPYVPPQYAEGNHSAGPLYRDDNPYSATGFSPGPPAPTPPGQHPMQQRY